MVQFIEICARLHCLSQQSFRGKDRTGARWYAYDNSGERTLQRTTIGGTISITVYAFGLEDYSYDGSGTLQSSTHSYSLDGRLIG